MKVTARATRSGEWWAVEVREVPGLFTQARRLDLIAAEVTDAAAMLGVEVTEVDVQASIPKSDRAELDAVRDTLTRLDHMQREAAERSRAVATHLRHGGLSVRDTGTLMGISPQRVSQLTSGV